MQKIVLVINAYKPDTAAINFACQIAALTKSRLTGLFVENLYHKPAAVSLSEASYFGSMKEKEEDTLVSTDADQAVQFFVQMCNSQKIAVETLTVKGEPIQNTLFESRFADLLLVSPGSNFYDRDENLPSHFTKELLRQAECPVLLTPDDTQPLNEIVFCYDGSASAVYAIKQFTYRFPELADKRLLILEANKSGIEDFDDAHRRMLAWLEAHYQTVTYQALIGDAKEALFAYFLKKRGKLVVMGSYGRNMLSRWFKPSAANRLIRTVDLPIFITHFNQ